MNGAANAYITYNSTVNSPVAVIQNTSDPNCYASFNSGGTFFADV